MSFSPLTSCDSESQSRRSTKLSSFHHSNFYHNQRMKLQKFTQIHYYKVSPCSKCEAFNVTETQPQAAFSHPSLFVLSQLLRLPPPRVCIIPFGHPNSSPLHFGGLIFNDRCPPVIGKANSMLHLADFTLSTTLVPKIPVSVYDEPAASVVTGSKTLPQSRTTYLKRTKLRKISLHLWGNLSGKHQHQAHLCLLRLRNFNQLKT